MNLSVNHAEPPQASAVSDERQHNLMLVAPTRIALASKVLEPAPRVFGATTLYVEAEMPFRISRRGSAAEETDFAILPPHEPHVVVSRDGRITKILIEPEAVAPADLLARFSLERKSCDIAVRRLREAFLTLDCWAGCADFDQLFFGEPLPAREIDHRVARAAQMLPHEHG